MLPPQTFYTQVVHEKGQKLQIWTWAPYRVQCPCLKSQHQLSWILLTFATAIMGTLSKTVRFPLYPSQWVAGEQAGSRKRGAKEIDALWKMEIRRENGKKSASTYCSTGV